jgi:hypothetical protein
MAGVIIVGMARAEAALLHCLHECICGNVIGRRDPRQPVRQGDPGIHARQGIEGGLYRLHA